MTSLEGMDEFFCIKDMEDVFDWTKQLEIVVEV
jgi:hypothetical protein